MSLEMRWVSKGIKGHEELHAHIDEEGSGTVWVRALEVDEKGEALRGVQVPLVPEAAKEFAEHLGLLAENATRK